MKEEGYITSKCLKDDELSLILKKNMEILPSLKGQKIKLSFVVILFFIHFLSD
jgi:hypothetical protein